MSDSTGRLVWYELMTTDTAAAKAFYSNVVGWEPQAGPPPNTDYTLFTVAGEGVAGLMDLPEDARRMGSPPSWIGYVAVDDVDAATEDAQRLGAKVYVAPDDIPDIGRFSVIADPQNAVITLFEPMGEPSAERPDGMDPRLGRVGWHELLTTDWEKAIDFYGELFGWQRSDAMDMGTMGTYQMFSTDGSEAIGGMFNKPPMIPATFWLYYFNVDDIDAASGRVTAGGGQIVNGPMEVPGGQWIIQGRDPQGAMFALVGSRG